MHRVNSKKYRSQDEKLKEVFDLFLVLFIILGLHNYTLVLLVNVFFRVNKKRK